MIECYCSNCGKLVTTDKYRYNDGYACGMSCFIKLTQPANKVNENSKYKKISYKDSVKKTLSNKKAYNKGTTEEVGEEISNT